MTTPSAKDVLLALADEYDSHGQDAAASIAVQFTWVAAADMARTRAAELQAGGVSVPAETPAGPGQPQTSTEGGDAASSALTAAMECIRAAQGDEFARREAWVIRAAIEAATPVLVAAGRAAERDCVVKALEGQADELDAESFSASTAIVAAAFRDAAAFIRGEPS